MREQRLGLERFVSRLPVLRFKRRRFSVAVNRVNCRKTAAFRCALGHRRKLSLFFSDSRNAI
jgi:hypothetical protein